MGWRHWTAGSLLIMAAAGGAFAWWWMREDPQVAKVRQLGRELFSENVSDEKRMELGRQMREETRNLTEEQRKAVFDDGRKQFSERINQYFKLSKEERVAFLDAEIDRMENMRKRMSERWAKEKKEGKSGGEKGNRPPGGGGPGGFRGPRDPAERKQFERKMLDSTTAEDRNKFMEFMKQMGQRRQERGLGGFPFGPRPN